MAYASRSSSGNRAATAVVVALLQGAAIYALVTGLAVTFFPQERDERLAGYQVKIKPPPPQPRESETVAARPKDVIQPPIDDRVVLPPIDPPYQPRATDPAGDGGILGGAGTGDGTTLGPSDPPSPRPSFTPRLARPTNKPGSWATAADYPAADLRRESQGVTRFTLAIGADGRVQSCQVDATSGSPSLDAATCRLVSARARFKPATDDSGAAVAGTYSSAIRWQIPRN